MNPSRENNSIFGGNPFGDDEEASSNNPFSDDDGLDLSPMHGAASSSPVSTSNSNSSQAADFAANSNNNGDAIVARRATTAPLVNRPPLVDVSSAGPFGFHNIECPTVLTPFIRERVEVPKQLLDRTLLKGEHVLKEFDVYYSEKHLSRHTRFFLMILTCGLYLIILCIRSIHRKLKRWCCLGDAYHTRGKIMITNYGRVLFWELTANQSKNPIEQRSHYQIAHCTHICNASDLKQSRVVYYDAGILCDYCLREFDVALELTFHKYSEENNRNKLLRVQSIQSFMNVIKKFIYQNDEQTKNFVSSCAGGPAPFTIAIVSDYWDKINSNYKHESGLEPLELLIDVLTAISGFTSSVTGKEVIPDAFFPVKDTRPVSMRGIRDKDIAGACEVAKDWHSFMLVNDEEVDKVAVPLKWMPLAPTEKVICAMGENHNLTIFDKILMVVTFGLYYCVAARRRSRQSEAVILTTKRIVHINLFQRRGRVPASLGNVELEVTSYYPGNGITAGYLRMLNDRIVSSIQSEAGAIAISLPKGTSTSIFCNGMQRVRSRAEPIATSLSTEIFELAPAKMLDYVNPSQRASSSMQTPTTDVLGLLVDNEQVVHMFEGGHNYAPCCSNSPGPTCEVAAQSTSPFDMSSFLSQCGAFISSIALLPCIAIGGENSTWLDIDSFSYLCSYPEAGYCTGLLVCLTKIVTCCLRPLARSNDLILTTNSLIFTSSVVYDENCLKRKSSHLGASFICWVPIRQLSSYQSKINATGAHTSGQCCCGLCCTLSDCTGNSRYTLDIFTRNGFAMSFSKNELGKNWLEDPDYMTVLAILGVVSYKTVNNIAPINSMERV